MSTRSPTIAAIAAAETVIMILDRYMGHPEIAKELEVLIARVEEEDNKGESEQLHEAIEQLRALTTTAREMHHSRTST